MGCSPALEDRPGGRVRPQAWLVLRTMAHIRVAWATPIDPAVRLRPTPSAALVQRLRDPTFWTMGAYPHRVGYTHPTMRQAPARTCAKGVALSDPKSPDGRCGGPVDAVRERGRPPASTPLARPSGSACGLGVDPPVRPRSGLGMIAVATPRCEASVIDGGMSGAGEVAGGRTHAWPIVGADRSVFRAANRLRQRRG